MGREMKRENRKKKKERKLPYIRESPDMKEKLQEDGTLG